MQQVIRILEWPVGWMQKQIEQISAFLWQFYFVLMIVMALISAVTAHICLTVERKGDAIRASAHPAVQFLGQLNEVTAKLKRP